MNKIRTGLRQVQPPRIGGQGRERTISEVLPEWHQETAQDLVIPILVRVGKPGPARTRDVCHLARRATSRCLGGQQTSCLQSAQATVIVTLLARREQSPHHRSLGARLLCRERSRVLRRTPPCRGTGANRRNTYRGGFSPSGLRRAALQGSWGPPLFFHSPGLLPAKGCRRGRLRRQGCRFLRFQNCDWRQGGGVDGLRRGGRSEQRRRGWVREGGSEKVAGRQACSDDFEIQLVANQDVSRKSGLLGR
jgi:hypothetical protein